MFFKKRNTNLPVVNLGLYMIIHTTFLNVKMLNYIMELVRLSSGHQIN